MWTKITTVCESIVLKSSVKIAIIKFIKATPTIKQIMTAKILPNNTYTSLYEL